MNIRRIAVIATAGALVAGGAGAAVGATQNDKAKEAEAQILADAAERLETTPEKLREALGAAEDAQLERAVKEGDLTQAQADAIRKRRQQSGRVLGIGPGPGHRGGMHHGPGGRGMHRGGPIADVADALGITERQLFTRLRAGKSIADIAKAEGKSLADVKAAVKAAQEKRLDQAVKDGRLTREQANEMLSHIDEMIDRLGSRRIGPGRGGHRHFPPGPPPGAPAPMPEPPQDENP